MRNIFSIVLTIIFFLCTSILRAQGVQQLWGTAQGGGNDGVGRIFSLKPNGTGFAVRHEFTTSFPGNYPYDTELLEYNNKFYGTTYAGGKFGGGVIFEWDPVTGIYSKKADFPSLAFGYPIGIITMIGNKIYGVAGTDTGTPGVIYEYDILISVFTKKFDFNSTVGFSPVGGLLSYNNKLYGMTMEGGLNNQGVVFVYDPQNNLYQKIIDFNGLNGRSPYISNFLCAYNNKIYGSVGRGGVNDRGVLFEIDPVNNSFVKKIELSSPSNVFVGTMTPYLGKLYGMTLSEIFEWDPITNIFAVKYTLPQGAYSCSKLVQSGGKFFGTTRVNLSPNSSYLFEWDPVSNNESKKAFFSETDGTFSGLSLKNNTIYGIQTGIGLALFGRVFSFNIISNQYKVEFDFLNSNNGVIPGERLFFNKGLLYGLTSQGGANNTGVVFTYNPSKSDYKKEADFESANNNLGGPMGFLSEFNGKLYGVAQTNSGKFFEWDTTQHLITTKINFTPANFMQMGITPAGGMVLVGSKFYGTMREGGNNNYGILYEWDPVTNVYIKKVDFSFINGAYPFSIVYSGGKIYGLTEWGGSNSSGVIFEWDPVSNIYTKKIDFGLTNGAIPRGKLVSYNNKLYGVTSSGGSSNNGVLYEWNPSSNSYTKLFDFDGINGAFPYGSPIIFGDKLYGTTLSGSNNFGVVYEWDFNTNSFSKKYEFDAPTGSGPYGNLIVTPAIVATIPSNTCTSFPSVTIDNSNNNQWVPITNQFGDVVAEIKANGNNLGTVSTSLYVNSGPVREDASKKLYLDRGMSITPQTQPTTPVDIRLYITEAEFNALKNATNSQGQPSGISSINDIGIFKNNDACNSQIIAATTQVNAANVVYDGGGYVISGSVNSFSSFYFANKTGSPLPLTLLSFSSKLRNNNAELEWKTANEYNTDEFVIQRSTDGRVYQNIGTVKANNSNGIHSYQFTDINVNTLGKQVLYYRLLQKDANLKQTYSNITSVTFGLISDVIEWPNPVNNQLNLLFTTVRKEKISIRIVDMNGRVIKQEEFTADKGSVTKSYDLSNLENGNYVVKVYSESIKKQFKIVKQ